LLRCFAQTGLFSAWRTGTLKQSDKAEQPVNSLQKLRHGRAPNSDHDCQVWMSLKFETYI